MCSESSGPRVGALGDGRRCDGGSVAGGRLGVDDVFSVLKHPRRRFIVEALAERESIPLDSLASRMMAAERDRAAETITREQVERGRISIVHVHTPVLADHDVAVLDTDADRLRAGANVHQLAEFLNLVRDFFESEDG